MTNTNAQEAPGSTITSTDDLRLDRFAAPTRSGGRSRRAEETVDAAGPVDAQTRPPGLGKRRTVSHSAHRHPRPLNQGETPGRFTQGPATGHRQPEPAAVASGLIRHPFAGRNSCR